MSSMKSPCAACKLQRRKCTQECLFAPYFPPENPEKFANVHKVFGASNVSKLLSELDVSQREDAVNSLEYEAKARLHDPVYGCVGLISILHQRLQHMRMDLENARKELATYLGPQATVPILSPPSMMPLGHHVGNPAMMQQQTMVPMMGIPTGASPQFVIRDTQQAPHQHQHQHPHQFLETQAQLAAAMAARDAQNVMFRANEQHQQHPHLYHQQQQETLRFNAGFDGSGSGADIGFNQTTDAGEMSPSLALGTYDDPYDQIQQQKQEHLDDGHPFQPQLLLQPQQRQQPQQTE